MMKSDGDSRGGLVSAGGILCTVSGVSQVINVVSAVIVLSPDVWCL
jgi:hypothetical protein